MLGDRYLEIGFEDICDNPEQEISRILRLIGNPAHDMNVLLQLVRKPKSIGPWKTYDENEVENVLRLGSVDLEHFRYM